VRRSTPCNTWKTGEQAAGGVAPRCPLDAEVENRWRHVSLQVNVLSPKEHPCLPPSLPGREGRRAFSLVEPVFVIEIIAILIGLVSKIGPRAAA
jgi:hypothetical protein